MRMDVTSFIYVLTLLCTEREREANYEECMVDERLMEIYGSKAAVPGTRTSLFPACDDGEWEDGGCRYHVSPPSMHSQ